MALMLICALGNNGADVSKNAQLMLMIWVVPTSHPREDDSGFLSRGSLDYNAGSASAALARGLDFTKSFPIQPSFCQPVEKEKDACTKHDPRLV